MIGPEIHGSKEELVALHRFHFQPGFVEVLDKFGGTV